MRPIAPIALDGVEPRDLSSEADPSFHLVDPRPGEPAAGASRRGRSRRFLGPGDRGRDRQVGVALLPFAKWTVEISQSAELRNAPKTFVAIRIHGSMTPNIYEYNENAYFSE